MHFSDKDGLRDKEFYDIIEDSKGFIWLCADKGLFRYNGIKYKNYKHKEQRGLSVFNGQEDYLGRVWCNNISGQFFYIENNKLQLFIDLSENLKGQLANFIIKKNYLWVFTHYKIYKVNLFTKKIEFTHNAKDVKILGAPFKLDDTIYFANIDAVFSINSKNQLKSKLAINLPFKDKNGNNVAVDNPILFKTATDIFFRQRRHNKNTIIKLNFKVGSKKVVNDFRAIEKERIYHQFENDNEIWFATSSGVWIYERILQSYLLKKRLLKNNNVTKIIKDANNNYWLTTLNDGIYIIPNINIETPSISIDNKNISSIDVVNDSTLVFGNIKGRIGFYNTLNDSEKIINLPTKDRVSVLKYHPIKNKVYISKDLSGYIYDPANKSVKNFKRFTTGKSITILPGNDLLFTKHNNANVISDSEFSTDINYLLKGEKTRTYASYYNSIDKSVYIAYMKGLIRYDSTWDPNDIQYKNKPIFANSITQTKNGIIWVATFNDGIFGIKNNTVIQQYSSKNGLTSNTVGKIKAVQNKLWITLENSIQLLDVTTNKIETLTKRDGIVSYDISGIEILNDKVYFSSNKGLFSIKRNHFFKKEIPKLYFNEVKINEKDTLITSNYTLSYNRNSIKIGFNVNGYLYNHKNKYYYRLKGFNNDWLLTDKGVNSVKYNSLPAGKYIFQVQPILGKEPLVNKMKSIEFIIKKPFWKTWWFILSILILLFGSTVFYYKRKLIKEEEERKVQLEKVSLEKELISINLTALRSQMNPHFIFNALNSIQDLILKEETNASYDYVTMFADLVRNTLNYSNQDFISIEKELDFLKLYLKLEKLRFGDAFNYTINFNEKDSIEVPSLLIQPFIENALVHGLMHKKGAKEIEITFKLTTDVLQCIITDNGIGRKEADKIASRQGNHHESFALSAIEKRLKIFKNQYSENIGYFIEDLYENKIAIGTRVTLTMPYKNKF
ncbi:sensor histidine kinase [Tenacibaculum haliotis]|uniref:sensor histidine kinase n=1 Tax=Tenacibaculum haliotis TaxID=1888914 RepID=UPI0021AEE830|nr:histidine kinase [Tenacibaculum haliotis]MCT4698783.1 histidine kinase [Tenacibaculum haliotis]